MQIKTEPNLNLDEALPTIIVAGSTTISATNLPGKNIVPVIHTTSANLTTLTSTKEKVTNASRPFDQIFPSPTASEPRSAQSLIQMMPSTPLMSVFDPAPNQQNSSQNAMDDLLAVAIVNMKPVCSTSSGTLSQFSSLTTESSIEFPTLIKTIEAFARFEERQRCLASVMRGAEVQVDGEYYEYNMQTYSIVENRALRLACITIGGF